PSLPTRAREDEARPASARRERGRDAGEGGRRPVSALLAESFLGLPGIKRAHAVAFGFTAVLSTVLCAVVKPLAIKAALVSRPRAAGRPLGADDHPARRRRRDRARARGRLADPGARDAARPGRRRLAPRRPALRPRRRARGDLSPRARRRQGPALAAGEARRP